MKVLSILAVFVFVCVVAEAIYFTPEEQCEAFEKIKALCLNHRVRCKKLVTTRLIVKRSSVTNFDVSYLNHKGYRLVCEDADQKILVGNEIFENPKAYWALTTPEVDDETIEFVLTQSFKSLNRFYWKLF